MVYMKTLVTLGLLLLSLAAVGQCGFGDPASHPERMGLPTIVETSPNELIGYTLLCDFPDLHWPKPSQAMVMSVINQRSYELAKELQTIVPRASTQFAGWLSGHRAAILEAVFFPKVGDTTGLTLWLDEYVIDLRNGRFFTPTGVNAVGFQNSELAPIHRNSESGYFSSNLDNGLQRAYTMRFDGSNKTPFPTAGSNTFGNHPCSISPNGELAACETPGPPNCGAGAQACIQIYDLATGSAGKIFGPALLGRVSWSPDNNRFVYLGIIPRASQFRNALVMVDVRAGTQVPIGGNVQHSAGGPGSNLGGIDAHFAGTELGEWSAKGDAYYNSVIAISAGHEYNRIGRIALENPNTFVGLTPEGVDARYPALAPEGSSFVCLAASLNSNEGPIQIYRFDEHDSVHFKELSHIKPGKVPADLRWRVETTVQARNIP